MKINPATARISIDDQIAKAGEIMPYSPNSKVKFSSDDASLRGCLANGIGIITLKKPEKSAPGVVEFLLSEFIPKPLVITPGGKTYITSKPEFNAYFKAKPESDFDSGNENAPANIFLVIDSLSFQLPQTIYVLDEAHVLYVHVSLLNGKSYNKIISSTGQAIHIDAALLFENGYGHYSDSANDMRVFYLIKGNPQKQKLISPFKPLFLTTNELKPEIAILLSGLMKFSDEEKLEYIYNYLCQYYGVPDKSELRKWCSREFALKVM